MSLNSYSNLVASESVDSSTIVVHPLNLLYAFQIQSLQLLMPMCILKGAIWLRIESLLSLPSLNHYCLYEFSDVAV